TTHAGSLQLRNVRAPVNAASDLGPIMITDLESDATLRAGSGGIELTRMTSGRADLVSRSGGCRIVQPANLAFTLKNRGKHPVIDFAQGMRRDRTPSDGQRLESLSRGSGGPVITVDAGLGECVIESDFQ
ncbi:hypothetical protein ACYOEI_25465, partial [Singulisphaera rosea]